jgi:dihydrofolate reductase
MISAIVAVNNDWGIGCNGELLEHIPEDLKYFKALTDGNIVVMGRKTWDSLPRKPLPNRNNLIITTNPIGKTIESNYQFVDMGAAKEIILTDAITDVFVIGGGTIYEELLPLCDRVYVTKINKSHENVDTYFPNLDESEEWTPALCSSIYDYKDFTYQFWQYDRI